MTKTKSAKSMNNTEDDDTNNNTGNSNNIKKSVIIIQKFKQCLIHKLYNYILYYFQWRFPLSV